MSAPADQLTPTAERLREHLSAAPYFIPAARIVELQGKLGYKSLDDLYVDLVNIAKLFAVVPVSVFQVGVVGVTSSGNVYMGCNLEFGNLPLNFSVHAEQCLIANLLRHEEMKKETLKLLIVNWPPCGHCRQFLSELPNSSTLQIRILDNGGKGPQDSVTIEELPKLLPRWFLPKDLGVTGEYLLRPFQWTLPHNALVPTNDPMVAMGLVAVADSWAPFTNCRSAVVIQMKNGTLYTGSYMENAAYNPSLSPMQSALTSLALNRCAWSDISAVLLLELEGLISQEGVTRLLLDQIHHGINLRVFRLPAEPRRIPGPTSS
eukprot:Mycagemm_TRINITY_DN9980_c0_g1::TRINITY_DN9980_c0_g1_i1::g.3530::m.3530 type:complete len:319 gc:universal TRINITY_DN9980_c0_g1_i1:1052-96(-)